MINTISLRDLGWDFYWDRDLKYKILNSDVIHADPGQSLIAYYGCAPDKLNEDGTVSKYNIIASTCISMYFAKVEDINVEFTFFSGETKEAGVDGHLYSMTMFDGILDMDTILGIRDYSESEIVNIKQASYHLGIEDSDLPTVPTQNNIDITKDAFGVDGYRMTSDINTSYLRGINIDYEYAFHFRFKVDIDTSFTILEVDDSIKIWYDSFIKKIRIMAVDHMTSREYEYETEHIQDIDDILNDILFSISDDRFILVRNGRILVDERMQFVQKNIKKYTKLTEEVSSGGRIPSTQSYGYASYHSFKYYDTEETKKLVFNGNVPGIMNSAVSVSRNAFPASFHLSTAANGSMPVTYYWGWSSLSNIPSGNLYHSANNYVIATVSASGIPDGTKIIPYVYIGPDVDITVTEDRIQIT